ncbi:MAG: ATP-binding protein [Nocardioidaceae bacterium]
MQLVSSRHERASLIVTSNKPFGRWGAEVFDDVVAAAMIDRLVHHAEVLALKGDSYRLKGRDLGASQRRHPRNHDRQRVELPVTDAKTVKNRAHLDLTARPTIGTPR